MGRQGLVRLAANCLEAVGAVDGAAPRWQERHLRRLAAVGADHVVELPGSTVAAGPVAAVAGAPRLSAVVAAPRLVEQAALGVELLLPGRESEFLAAVATGQRLVRKAHVRALLGRFHVACGKAGTGPGIDSACGAAANISATSA